MVSAGGARGGPGRDMVVRTFISLGECQLMGFREEGGEVTYGIVIFSWTAPLTPLTPLHSTLLYMIR